MNRTARKILVFTDGSTDVNSAAVSVIVSGLGRTKMKISCLLSPLKGDEVELLAGVLGLYLVSWSNNRGNYSLEWITDSKSNESQAKKVLSSPAPPSELLWQVWRNLAHRFAVDVFWTRAHAGHRENEACDRACRWIRKKGDALLRLNGEGAVGLLAKRDLSQCWHVFDLRELNVKDATSISEQFLRLQQRVNEKISLSTFS